MESPPSYKQPEGSADPSAELSDTPTGEATRRSSNDVEEENGLQTVDKNPGQQPKDESQDNSSSEKSTDNNAATPTEKETAQSSIVDVASVEGENSLQTVDKNPGQKANDESQDNSSSEKSTDKTTSTPTGADSDEGNGVPPGQQPKDESQDHSSSEKSTDNNTATPTEKETAQSSIVDVASVEGENGQRTVDKDSGRKAIDESQDNSSSSEKSTEEVNHPAEQDKIIDNQADDGRQSCSKGNPSENEKSVDTTPGEFSSQRGIKLLVGVAIVALVAIVAQYYLQSESQPQKTDWQQVDVFLKHMKNVKAKFPNQRAELWSRSEIHLKRHLQTSQPTEPVSLILTSGVRAERTMRCLAQGVASAFSTARNASILHIDGAGKAGQDSDQVKLDIDRKLQGAFEGDKPVAVIHRLEELPPGSTLIFYRYCDHENAAYKKTFLIFTVLLGDKEEIPAEMRLCIVEEMVDDYLQKKFLSHSHPVSFDRMDLNKYGGLWSRISHLILPVAAEDRIEHEGC